ncbi:MAG: response regulator [Lachnospiraceae bacterium]|nr:response regulator [Lachnospiraceae bacterium]
MTCLRILAVDNERMTLTLLSEVIREAAGNARLYSFLDPVDAMGVAREFMPDVAFLNTELPNISGLELANQLKAINPRINIIFTTDQGHYMEDAFQMYASGYILKPVTAERIRKELENLRFPLEDPAIGKRVKIQAFGAFEVFIDGKPAVFSYARTKELLAVLIDHRGAMCTNGKLISILWEEEEDIVKHSSYIRNLISDLVRVFRGAHLEDVIIRKRGEVGIDRSRIDCDYYEYLDGSRSLFNGEYMSQYSWAEETLAELLSRTENG